MQTVVVVSAAALVLVGCTIGENSGGQDGRAQGAESSKSEEAAPAPIISVKDGAENVNPSNPVKVTAGEGDTIKKVTMTNENGYEVESKLSADGKTWTTDETLGYYRTYTVKAVGKNGETSESVFTTISPDSTSTVAIGPLDGSTVGVGRTISFRFSQPVNDRKKAEELLNVETSPKVEGAFYWLNDYEVRWRPKDYWEPGTEVSVSADIYGQSLGGGVYGDSDNSASFTIGDRVIAEVDDNTKTMTVYRNGEVLRTIPVSLGSNTYPTPNGVYIIGDKHESLLMDSETFGLAHDAGGYKLDVAYATQMSYSGIYVHAAPWSVWAQGNTNQSHGCVNVTTDAAQWFQNTVKAGDLVIVKNTIGDTLSGYDGLGDWNIPWETWKKGNADEN